MSSRNKKPPFERKPDHGESIDPKIFFGGSRPAPKRHQKTLQLCRQVKHAVEDGLAMSTDEILQSLMVVSVVPAPSAGRLMVAVQPQGEQSAKLNPNDLLELVDREKGNLRAEVATQIHRKRVPALVFRVAAPWEVMP